jgi:outer membrane murein-binding lipoprotein Lpp
MSDNDKDETQEIIRYLEAKVETFEAELADLRSQTNQAWRERNEAVTRLKSWERIVCLTPKNSTLMQVPSGEWGPGEDSSIVCQVPNVESLGKVLEQLDAYQRKYGPL